MKQLSNGYSPKYSFLFFPFVVLLLFASNSEAELHKNNIPSLNAKVSVLRFFETGYQGTPYNERIYKNSFPGSSKYISWELHLEYPAIRERINFGITHKYFKPDGSLLSHIGKDIFFLPPNTTSNHFFGAAEWRGAGHWAPGTYKVELFIQGHMVASGSFNINSSNIKPVEQSISLEKDKNIRDIAIPDDLGEL